MVVVIVGGCGGGVLLR
ncbi:hypothetical protein M0804_014655 [Polistes exclamans]|nr:hypothetical protein M0804_014656 [Polistes exclamans]KAI4474815.1 hypothetical protein M0804_014655 [Polistes exclamans]